MYDSETGVTTLSGHSSFEQFPRLWLLVIDLNTAQQCIAVVAAITNKYHLNHCQHRVLVRRYHHDQVIL